MDDLDLVLSRLAASTRTRADESVDIDAAIASTLARSADTAEVMELADHRSPRARYVTGATALVGVLLVGVWAVAWQRDEGRLVPVSPVATKPTESVPTQTDPGPDSFTTTPAILASPELSEASTIDESPSGGAGRLIDVDEMAQATEQLQLPDPVPDLSLELDDGITLVVELAFAPGQVAEMVCVNNYVDGGSTGRTCGDPTEIGGLLTFGLFEGKAAVLSNIDQPIEFEASSCREQWIVEAAPFKLQVCDTAGEFATVNGRDADGRPAHIELWGA